MTLKMTMMGAALAASLLGTVGQAKADVVRVNGTPPRVEYLPTRPRVEYVQPGRRRGLERHRRPYRAAVAPVVAVPVPSYGYGYGYARVAAGAQDPSVVAAQIRAETDRAAEDLRFDVRQGLVEPRALASLGGDRDEIERDLAAASAKGYITADDRAHLEQHVQEIRDLRSQFRCAPQGQVIYRR